MRLKALAGCLLGLIVFGVLPEWVLADYCASSGTVSVNKKYCQRHTDGTHTCENDGAWVCNGSYDCVGNSNLTCSFVGNGSLACSGNAWHNSGSPEANDCSISADRRSCNGISNPKYYSCWVVTGGGPTPAPGCTGCDTSGCDQVCSGDPCGRDSCGNTCSSGTRNCAGDSAPKGWQGSPNTSGGVCQLTGWTCDPDRWSQALWVHFYDGGGAYVGATLANVGNEQAVTDECGGTQPHRFVYNLPASYVNGNTYSFTAYGLGIDGGGTQNGNNPPLQGNPKSVTCGSGCTLPGAPGGLSVTCNGSATQATVSWGWVANADYYSIRADASYSSWPGEGISSD